MTNVLVVEDSRVTREYLVGVLESDPNIRVIATAADGEAALTSVGERKPDVILMDLNLPGIDGFEAIRRIMATSPVPIVACTASTRFDDVQTAMRALEAGALAALKKPAGIGDPAAAVESSAIVNTLKLMAEVKVVRRWNHTPPIPRSVPVASTRPFDGQRVDIVAIGASTGGPPVLAQIVSALPQGFPVPILIVQHIAAGFTQGLAEWLRSLSRLPVEVARHGEIPRPGCVYLAPDDLHLRIGPRGEMVTDNHEPHGGLRPAVAVLFRSVAERFGRHAIGVLLTGMGRDGADELRLMADTGALTIAQDQQSCAVFGMPAEAIKLGAARFVFSPDKIANLLMALASQAGRIETPHD